MSEEFGKDLGLIHECVVTGRKAGATKEFWAALAHSEELFKRVVAFVAEAIRVVFQLAAKIDRNMAGWTCVEPVVEAAEAEFEPFLEEFLQGKETSVKGEEMVKRARSKGISSGLRHAEAMLRNQEKIPVEWRKFYLVFPEVWQDSDGNRLVFSLYWSGERWYLDYYWLGFGFGSCGRLVGSRKLE